MKKGCLLLVLMPLLLVSCDTIRIAMDSTNTGGERRIMTNNQDFFRTQGYEVGIAGGVLIQGKDTLAGLVITCDAPVKKALFEGGSKMHIRLNDDQTIVLSNMLDRESDSHTETEVHDHLSTTDYDYVYSQWGPALIATPIRVTSMECL